MRTYVRVGDTPGIYFFSLDASNPVAVMVARTMFNLPYFAAAIDVEHRDAYVHYHSRRPDPGAEFTGRYRPMGPVHEAVPGTLDYFLTERYCLYTLDSSFHLQRLEIHHPPWQLQPAEADIQMHTMAAAAGIRLPSMAPVLHFSRRQDMVAWPLMKVGSP